MSEICAACAGGPSDGKFKVNQVKSARLTLTGVELLLPKMGSFGGVSICGACMQSAINDTGVVKNATNTKPSGEKETPPAAVATTAADTDTEDESPLVRGIADSIERMRTEGFNPDAPTSIYNATSRSEYTP